MKNSMARFLMSLVFVLFSQAALADKILSYSDSMTGNGLNWSGTMGWMAENLRHLAEQAQAYEKQTGERALIYINSSVGSSSGSAMGILLSSALSNPSLVKNPGERMLTAEEVLRVAEMIRFISIGSDYKFWVGFKTVASVFVDWSHDFMDRLYKWISLVAGARYSEAETVRKGLYFASRKAGIKDFSKVFAFARTVEYSRIHIPIYRLQNFETWKKIGRISPEMQKAIESVDYIADYPTDVTSDDALAKKSSVKKFLDWQKEQARQIMLGLSQNLKYDGILNEKFADGMMTGALGEVYEEKDAAAHRRQKPTFDMFKFFVFVNESTAQKILESESYRSEIKNPDSILNKYIIAVIKDKFTAMNNSIQEPGLFEILEGSLEGAQIGVSKIYDPTADPHRKFELENTAGKNLRVNVIGGFPYQPIVSLLQPSYLEVSTKELANNNRSAEIVPVHFSLAHKMPPSHPKQYPIQVVRHSFSGEDRKLPADQNRYVQAFLDWNERALNLKNKILSQNKTNVFDGFLNWDLHLLPARLVGKGHYLALDGKTTARQSLESIRTAISAPLCRQVLK